MHRQMGWGFIPMLQLNIFKRAGVLGDFNSSLESDVLHGGDVVFVQAELLGL